MPALLAIAAACAFGDDGHEFVDTDTVRRLPWTDGGM